MCLHAHDGNPDGIGESSEGNDRHYWHCPRPDDVDNRGFRETMVGRDVLVDCAVGTRPVCGTPSLGCSTLMFSWSDVL